MAGATGLFGVLLVVLALSLGQEAYSIGSSGGIARGEAIGPGFFPQVYLWGMGVSGALLVVLEPDWRQTRQELYWRPVADASGVMCLLLLYWLGLIYTGYLASTFLFQSAIIRIAFRKRGAIWLLLVPGIMTIGAISLFQSLGVALPRGSGWFYALNRILF